MSDETGDEAGGNTGDETTGETGESQAPRRRPTMPIRRTAAFKPSGRTRSSQAGRAGGIDTPGERLGANDARDDGFDSDFSEDSFDGDDSFDSDDFEIEVSSFDDSSIEVTFGDFLSENATSGEELADGDLPFEADARFGDGNRPSRDRPQGLAPTRPTRPTRVATSQTRSVEQSDRDSVVPRAGAGRSNKETIDALFDFIPQELGEGERLQKVLARVGVGSRRVCEDLIAEGRVRVNDEVAILGRRVDPERDAISIDGAPVGTKAGLVYYLLNKPAGVVTTADDPQGRPTVLDLVPADVRVFPVGRLDIETEGLLILTNDGELTYRLTHPSFGVEKEYLAEVRGRPTPKTLAELRRGVELEDGVTAPASASMQGEQTIRLTIHEGRNRQVRRMLDAVGFPVRRLVRVRIGTVQDRYLQPGQWRMLRPAEVLELAHLVRDDRARRRARQAAQRAAVESGEGSQS